MTVTDPESGTVTTTTGAIDLVGGGSFTITVEPGGGGGAVSTLDVHAYSVTAIRDSRFAIRQGRR